MTAHSPIPLFRPEVLAARKDRLHGDISLAVPMSWQLIGYLLFGALAVAGVPVSSAAAQSAAPPAKTYRVDLHFAPPSERKPLPYDLVHGIPMFRAQLNGKDVWGMLDDGTTGSVVSSEFVRANGLKPTAVVGQVVTPTGTLERRAISGIAVNLPGQMNFEGHFSVQDLSFMSKVARRPISLIIGKDFFDHLEFVFTPGDRHIQLGPSGTLKLPPSTPTLTMKDDAQHLDVLIGGRPAVLAVDLGYQGDVVVSDDAWQRLGLDELPATEGHSAYSDGNIQTTKWVTAPKLKIGPIQFADVRVTRGRTLSKDIDGMVGFGLLSRYNFAIDVKNRRILMVSKVE